MAGPRASGAAGRPARGGALALLGLGLLLAGASGRSVSSAAAKLTRASAAPTNLVAAENALPGDASWETPEGPAPGIEAYTSEVSVLPGGTVHFHVSTNPEADYRIKIYRLGWYGADADRRLPRRRAAGLRRADGGAAPDRDRGGAGGRLVACLPGCESDNAGQAQPVPSPDPWTGEVRADWPVSAVLDVGSDWVSGYYLAKIILTTGEQRGGVTLVPFIVREPPTRRSAILVQAAVNTWQAYNPWGGKSLYSVNSTNGQQAVGVSFDRPYGRGSQSPFFWEYQLVRFLERKGYDVSYTTDVDTDRDPSELQDHRLVIVAGHDEYWTKEIRDAFEAARDTGTNLAFLGANSGYWQARYEDGGRTLVEYRSQRDPIGDPARKTVRFRDLAQRRPECSLLGVQSEGGLAAAGDPPRDYAPNPAALDDPWFARTGFGPTTTLSDLVGYEWDAVQAGCAVPGSLTVFFHYEGHPSNADAVRYVAPSGARVFSAGSLQFSWGLDDWGGHDLPASPALQQFMRNVLDDLMRSAAPTSFEVNTRPGRVDLSFGSHPDPRVSGVRIVRHEGPDPFDLSGPGVEVVCETAGTTCSDTSPIGGAVYRYAAVTVDRWGTSLPLFSPQVSVPPTGACQAR